jgi:shikimate kinase
MHPSTSPEGARAPFPPIFLIGFMGCGKTTVGGVLASRIRGRFVDLDERVVTQAGRSIPEIFHAEGEEGFRRREHAALRAVCQDIEAEHGTPVAAIPFVIALGGGTFAQTANRDLVGGTGVSVWLDAPFEILLPRLVGQPGRPLMTDISRAQSLYQTRRPLYALADFRIEIKNLTPDQMAEEIVKALQTKFKPNL